MIYPFKHYKNYVGTALAIGATSALTRIFLPI
jgi:hypothetical protein